MKRALVIFFLAVPFSLWAYDSPSSYNNSQQNDYQPWRSNDQRIQELLQDLNSLIDKADQARAADPNFLRDLRALTNRYGDQWPQRYALDDFSDGNFNRSPSWQVLSGSFWVDAQRGLRNIGGQETTPQNDKETRRDTEDEIKTLLLEALLKGKKEEQSSSAQTSTEVAQIKLPANISNAFRLTTNITISKKGQYVGLFLTRQKGNSFSGYRLFYRPGHTKPLQLVRLDENRQHILKEYNGTLDLADGRKHEITWSRDRAGNMLVAVDGKQVMNLRDTAYLYNYDSFTLANAGNDISMRRIEIYGTE